MKQYILFCWSHSIGGGQNYVNSKVKYLEENNWKVIVFSGYDYTGSSIPWENLKKFSNMTSVAFNRSPRYCFKPYIEKTLKWMESFIDTKKVDQSVSKFKCDDHIIIIESGTDFWAEWGEMLAERLKAKHFCFLLDERLEEYQAKEFLYYKFLRGEVAGIHKSSIERLFKNYKEIKNTSYVLKASNYGNVADIYNEAIENIPKSDYNISYFGNNKKYVYNIICGIFTFAKKHPDKNILLIVLGSIGDWYNFPNNVHYLELGFLHPIPKSFFKHVDVIIAGAGCAGISARNGVPTIVADASSFDSNGILGYTTKESLFSEVHEKYEDSLENVLISKEYINHNFELNEPSACEDSYSEHFEFVENSSKNVEYYNVLNDNKVSNITKLLVLIYNILNTTTKGRAGIARRKIVNVVKIMSGGGVR